MAICALVLYPMLFMIDGAVGKIIPSIAMLFHGYSSVMLPWGLDLDYTAPKIILGITVVSVALVLFITALQTIWIGKKN